MDMPPSRYRVVQRGRRLEVIDTGADDRAQRIVSPAQPKEPGESATGGWFPRQVRFDGTRRWTTHPFYDANGPRTVTVVPGALPAASSLGAGVGLAAVALVLVLAFAPWGLLAIGAVLFNPKARARLRDWSTRAIDRIAADDA